MCSMLLFYGGVCQACNITYKNGKVVSPKKLETKGTEGQRD